jgi:hypothetical protein
VRGRIRINRLPGTARRRWPPALVAVVLALIAPALAAGPAPAASASAAQARLAKTVPIGLHSMLYLSTPYGAMKDMFQQAADMGASDIRLNIELSSVFPGPRRRGGTLAVLPGPLLPPRNDLHRRPGSDPLADPHWGAVDEYMRLARAYHMHVLAVLTSTPAWMADCPRGTPSSQLYRCPPRDPREWGRAVAKIAAHTAGVINRFEVLNEPDAHWSFLGSPQQYAAVLAASYDAVHGANPTAQVALGGLMHLDEQGMSWMDRMLATRGTQAAHKFDVANLHVRLPPVQVAPAVCRWRDFFAHKGFNGPLWVTETGYPANPAQQTDPGYEYGARAQARWLTTVVPALLAAGVSKVFVTERDLGQGRFASEGVLQTPDPLTSSPRIRRRPSFYAMQRLARGAWVSAEAHASRQSGGC